MNKSFKESIPIIFSKVTYLELNNLKERNPFGTKDFFLKKVQDLSVSDYLNIYREIGKDYLWNYRPGQTTSEISEIINSSNTWIYLLYEGTKVIGMAELDVKEFNLELVHFGLIKSFQNKGIGKSFLNNMINIAVRSGVQRLWLSTCEMDHPKAISFYQAAGFKEFKSEIKKFKDWRFSGFYDMNDAPQIPYGIVE